MSISSRIQDWLDRWCRKRDLMVLWPSCCSMADDDIERAKQAFRLHIAVDRAWQVLPVREIDAIVANLKWELAD